MKIVTTMGQRWGFFIGSCFAVSLVTVLFHTPLLLAGLFPIGIVMWKLIDWAIEYQEPAKVSTERPEEKR